MRKALFIGINDYEWSHLNGCANDAISLAKTLMKHYDEAPNFDCKVIISDKKNNYTEEADYFGEKHFENTKVTRTKIRKSIEKLFDSECSIALLFFSGHGYENSLGGYLVAEDATRYDEGVSVSDVITLANSAMHINEIVIILDCCHSGHLGNVPLINGENALLSKGLSILTSSTPNQVSVESNGLGLFTSILIEGLKGAAADVSGRITTASLYNCADRILGAYDQRPVFKSHVISLSTLRNAEPYVPIKWIRMIPVFFKDQYERYPLDKSYEPTEKPRDTQNEEKFKILQKLTAVNLVRPVDEDHMYYAAIHNKSCELTPLGQLYWTMVKNNRI